MRVLRSGWGYALTCEQCTSLYEAEASDFRFSGFHETTVYCFCPVCGTMSPNIWANVVPREMRGLVRSAYH